MKIKAIVFYLLIILAFVFTVVFTASGLTTGVSNEKVEATISFFSNPQLYLLIYILPLLAIWTIYIGLRSERHLKYTEILDESVKAGLTEPCSLHPVINLSRCKGCGSCVNACPEQDSHSVLGIIDGKCHLVSPAHCIGHGVCAEVCPQSAITLVFGTPRRGVDIPRVKNNFETDVPGIFIAGELGGRGLIHNAIIQGREAIKSIRKLGGIGQGSCLDVVIVGAGPAGFSASLAALEHGLRFVTVEQDSLGGTVNHYPKNKVVMTAPVHLPLVGMVRFKEITKEELLGFWQGVERKTGVSINYKERLESITQSKDGFKVTTSRATYHARAVLLAIGRGGTPRKLGVPGEELPKVVYRVIDPEQYQGNNVLVVGGGDSALEAAASIAALPNTTVCLAYRGDAFSRAKEKNRRQLLDAESCGSLQVFMKSNVSNITSTHVHIERKGEQFALRNDAVIICAGGTLPTPFLKKIGITVETKYGTP